MQDNQLNQLNYDAAEIRKALERFYTPPHPNEICLGILGGGRVVYAREEIEALKNDQKGLD